VVRASERRAFVWREFGCGQLKPSVRVVAAAHFLPILTTRAQIVVYIQV
jgi:hypothetical protein